MKELKSSEMRAEADDVLLLLLLLSDSGWWPPKPPMVRGAPGEAGAGAPAPSVPSMRGLALSSVSNMAFISSCTHTPRHTARGAYAPPGHGAVSDHARHTHARTHRRTFADAHVRAAAGGGGRKRGEGGVLPGPRP